MRVQRLLHARDQSAEPMACFQLALDDRALVLVDQSAKLVRDTLT